MSSARTPSRVTGAFDCANEAKGVARTAATPRIRKSFMVVLRAKEMKVSARTGGSARTDSVSRRRYRRCLAMTAFERADVSGVCREGAVVYRHVSVGATDT